jgi:hypothetical protein
MVCDGRLHADAARAKRLDAEIVGESPQAQKQVTASQVQKSGGISRLQDMGRTPIERLETV